MALPIVGILVLGVLTLLAIFHDEDEEERRKLIHQSFIAAQTIDQDNIDDLTHDRANHEEKAYVREQLTNIINQSDGSIEYATIFIVKDGIVRILAENQVTDTPLAFSPDLIHKFSQPTPFTFGPFKDLRGQWISAYHPLPMAAPGTPTWVGLDMKVENWALKIVLDTLPEITATVLGMLLILALIYTYLSNSLLHRQLVSDRFLLDTVSESARNLFKQHSEPGLVESFEILSKGFQADRISCFRFIRTEEGEKKYAKLEGEWVQKDSSTTGRKKADHKHPTIHISIKTYRELLAPGVILTDTSRSFGLVEEDTAPPHTILLALHIQNKPYGFLLLESRESLKLSSYGIDALRAYGQALQRALDRHETLTQIHLFHLAIDASGTGMMITDAREHGNPIIYANNAFLETTGLHEDEILGKTLGESALTAIIPSAIHSIEKAMRLDTVYTDVHPLKISSSRPRWIETTLSSVRDSHGELLHHLLTIVDISDLKEAILTAQKASEVKMLFLANMSHEIRTPMNSVLGMSELLLQQPMSDGQRHYCEIIQKSANNLVSIVNDILEISKIESGHLAIRKSTIDLMDCIESALQICSMNAASKDLDLFYFVEKNVPRLIPADGVRLRQVLINLISNAVKFTEVGEVEVYVTLGNIVQGKTQLVISVRDTGIGIPAEQQSELFEAFKQVDSSTTRQYGGTGLGLAISRRLVNLMGGEIILTSTPGHGANFEFDLPLTPPIETGWSELTGPLKNRSLLLVGSTPAYQRFFTNFCKIQEMNLTTLDHLPEKADPSSLYDFLIVDERMMDPNSCPTHQKLTPFVTPETGKTILLSFTPTPKHPAPACSKDFDAVLSRPIPLSDLPDWLLALGTPVEPAQTQALTPASPSSQLPHFQGMRVLIVDDNNMNCLVATEQIKQFGCHVTSVESGMEALKLMPEVNYDVIFLDCQMPKMDGYETAQHIREVNSKNTHTPIIALTADVLPATKKKCLDAGMNDFATKPLHIQALKAILTKYLNKAAKAREANTSSTTHPELSRKD